MTDARRVVRVTILGTTYSVVSDRDEAYVQSLADYLDGKLAQFFHGRSLPVLQQVILTALNVADELFREREHRQRWATAIGERADRLLGSLDESAAAVCAPGEAERGPEDEIGAPPESGEPKR